MVIAKLLNERARSFADHPEEIYNVFIFVIVDFEAIPLRLSEKHSTRTAERFDIPVIVSRKNRVENF